MYGENNTHCGYMVGKLTKDQIMYFLFAFENILI